jgi:hypothetical protein
MSEENVEHGEEPNESAWNEDAVEGQLDELEDEEQAEREDDEEEGLDED